MTRQFTFTVFAFFYIFKNFKNVETNEFLMNILFITLVTFFLCGTTTFRHRLHEMREPHIHSIVTYCSFTYKDNRTKRNTVQTQDTTRLQLSLVLM